MILLSFIILGHPDWEKSDITQMETINPINDKYHLDLKDGLYEGDEPKWFRNDIKHKEP